MSDEEGDGCLNFLGSVFLIAPVTGGMGALLGEALLGPGQLTVPFVVVGALIGAFAPFIIGKILDRRSLRRLHEEMAQERRARERAAENARVRASREKEREERRREVLRAQRDEERRRKEAEEEKRAEEYNQDKITQSIRSAAEDYAAIPSLIESAHDSLTKAQKRFEDGAFSPFWEEVEYGYSALADFRTRLDSIAEARRIFISRAAERDKRGWEAPEDAYEFPDVGITQVLISNIEKILDGLNAVVYEAQRIPTFAQIWEQRRTTQAVITGFKSLEQAVRHMSHAMRESIEDVTQALLTTTGDIRALHPDHPSQSLSRMHAELGIQPTALERDITRIRQAIESQKF